MYNTKIVEFNATTYLNKSLGTMYVSFQKDKKTPNNIPERQGYHF